MRGARRPPKARGRRNAYHQYAGKGSKLEQRYAAYLNALLQAGEIVFWRHQDLRLQIGATGRNVYSPDFTVQTAAGLIQCIEVKPGVRGKNGAVKPIREDASYVRLRAAARLWPPFEWVLAYEDPSSKCWRHEIIEAID